MDSLTRRQAAGLVAAAALGAATATAALLDQLRIAVAGLALLAVALFLSVLALSRQLVATRARLAGDLRSVAGQAEAAQQRLLSSVEEGQRADADRHRELLGAVQAGQAASQESARQAMAQSARQLGTQLIRRQRETVRELEALGQLLGNIRPRAPLPPSGHWALNPSELLELWFVIEQRRPELVLELGSGTSSVWIGYALERYGGRLVSIDHDPAYAGLARVQLQRHGLAGVAEVRDAPLCPLTLEGETYQWYDPAALAGLPEVDLLLVDGPPGTTGPLARYPAVPFLLDRLSPQATVALDDADRADELEIVRRWTGSVPGLVRQPATLGQLAVLTYTAA